MPAAWLSALPALSPELVATALATCIIAAALALALHLLADVRPPAATVEVLAVEELVKEGAVEAPVLGPPRDRHPAGKHRVEPAVNGPDAQAPAHPEAAAQLAAPLPVCAAPAPTPTPMPAPTPAAAAHLSPPPTASTPRCALAACLRELEGRFRRCGGCRLVHYCSPEHQAEDWPSHRNFCKAEQTRLEAAAVAGGVVVREASGAELERARVGAMGVRELRAALAERGVDTRGLTEREDLVDALLRAPAPLPERGRAAAATAAREAAVGSDAEAEEAEAEAAAEECAPRASPLGDLETQHAAAQAWIGRPLSEYRAGAERGDAAAQYMLGNAYDFGSLGLSVNKGRAAELYRSAAAAGSAQAQFCLGVLFEKGDITTRSADQAARFYRLAAEQGLPSAIFNLGILCRDGAGVLQDYAAAASHFRRAAKLGHVKAAGELALCYMLGRGAAVDCARAMRWARRAADRGDAGAMSTAGLLCEVVGAALGGVDVAAAGRAEAALWFERSVAAGMREGVPVAHLRSLAAAGVVEALAAVRRHGLG